MICVGKIFGKTRIWTEYSGISTQIEVLLGLWDERIMSIGINKNAQ
jgi:hypothetical protein